MKIVDIRPTTVTLGVRLDRDKLAHYAEEYRRLGPYPYDQDPLCPNWCATVPNARWADPEDARVPDVPTVVDA